MLYLKIALYLFLAWYVLGLFVCGYYVFFGRAGGVMPDGFWSWMLFPLSALTWAGILQALTWFGIGKS